MRTIFRMLVVACLMTRLNIATAQDIESLKPGIVKITSEVDGKRKTGTGFIVKVSPDSLFVVTASHVVEGDQHPKLEFFVQRNRPVDSDIIKLEGGDPKGLALLTLRGKIPEGLVALRFAPEQPLKGGDAVETIGFGQGQGEWAVIRAYIVSLDGRDLRIGGTLAEGNSGGPVIIDGQVVGLVTGVEGNYATATPSNFIEFILKNWGAPIASGGGSPKADPGSAKADHAQPAQSTDSSQSVDAKVLKFAPEKIKEVAYLSPSDRATGLFRNIAPGTWVETGSSPDDVRFRFQEIGRDANSINLADRSRGVLIRLNLTERVVLYKEGSDGDFQQLYKITNARTFLSGQRR